VEYLTGVLIEIPIAASSRGCICDWKGWARAKSEEGAMEIKIGEQFRRDV
tara:strand:- start:10 stop:159 length:150 start_codon:yes stop_codon:yes gene_type:complete